MGDSLAMKRASTSAPSSPTELVSSASVASVWLCDSASHSAVMPFSPIPFLLKSAAWHLRHALESQHSLRMVFDFCPHAMASLYKPALLRKHEKVHPGF